MSASRLSLLGFLLAGVAPAPLYAQEGQPPEPGPVTPEPAPVQLAPASPVAAVPADEAGEDEEEAIVVRGQPPRGSVPGNIRPIETLNARDVRSYGASTVGELVEALAPQTRGAGGGQPVVLLNGQRISSFGEIRGIPPEAISRVEILPEEVALQFGYRPDQRVVNMVLRRRFRAVTVQVGQRLATDGGFSATTLEGGILRIGRNDRWNVEAEYSDQGPLLESERRIRQSATSFDLAGNIIPSLGVEIDPALSALAGTPVTIAGVPVSAVSSAPGLAAFLPGANNPNVSEVGQYRSLVDASRQLQVNGTYSRTIFRNVAASLNLRVQASDSERLFGLPEVSLLLPAGNPFSPFGSDVVLNRYYAGDGPLRRDSNSLNLHGGLTMSGDLAPQWRWNFTANYDWARSVSRTGNGFDSSLIQARLDADDPAVNPYAPLQVALLTAILDDRVEARTENANAQLLVNGRLFQMPAGPVTASFRIGGATQALEGESFRGGITDMRDLGRTSGSGQVSIDVPIARRNRDVLAFLGDLSLNANAEVEQVSDFGTLTTLGAGLSWTPIAAIQVIASYQSREIAPSMQQLGDPLLIDPNARVFDFQTGRTVDITRISGGNPDLLAESRRTFRLGLNVRPFSETDLVFTASYVRIRIDDPIAQFPTATPEIEAAFPSRFIRDLAGNLVSIDSRPINFASAAQQQLRYGVTYSRPIQNSPPPGGWEAFRQRMREARERGEGPPEGFRRRGGGDGEGGFGGGGGRGGRGGFGGGGRGGFGGGGFGGRVGRINFGLFHTIRMQDEVLIRPGVPVLDFLDGSAAGNLGGNPRHEVEAQAGIFRDGMGAQLNLRWQSGTRVDGALGGTTDLEFSPLTTVNLRLFADLSQQRSLVRSVPFLRGTRISVEFNNLFDQRIEVRDANGLMPLSYQPGYVDPIGRSITFTLRKLFF